MAARAPSIVDEKRFHLLLTVLTGVDLAEDALIVGADAREARRPRNQIVDVYLVHVEEVLGVALGMPPTVVGARATRVNGGGHLCYALRTRHASGLKRRPSSRLISMSLRHSPKGGTAALMVSPRCMTSVTQWP